MEVNTNILLMIIGAAIVTMIPRVLPLVLLSRIKIPEWGMRWLNFVPIAVMSALVGQELFVPGGKLSFGPELIAALPTLAVAAFTRSLLGTVLTGIVSMMLLRYVL